MRAAIPAIQTGDESLNRVLEAIKQNLDWITGQTSNSDKLVALGKEATPLQLVNLVNLLAKRIGLDGVTTIQELTNFMSVASAGAQQPGEICFFAQNTAPDGFLKANGAAISRTTYANLFAALVKQSTAAISIATPGVVTWNSHGRSANDPIKFTTAGALPTGLIVGTTYYVVGASITTNTFQLSAAPGGAAIATSGTQSGTHTAINAPWGNGDGSTTFNVPELRGEFLRGWDDARGVDVARAFGSSQADEIKSHTHTLQTDNSTFFAAGSGAKYAASSGDAALDVSGSTGGAETRPRSVALLACIKY